MRGLSGVSGWVSVELHASFVIFELSARIIGSFEAFEVIGDDCPIGGVIVL